MAVRRLIFAFVAAVLGCSTPAIAGPRTQVSQAARAVMRGDVNAMLRFLHAQPGIDRVAVRDVDNDGALDVIAAPRHGGLRFWRNAGDGHFKLIPRTRAPRDLPRGPRLRTVRHAEDVAQWGDFRCDATMPRGPATVAGIVQVTFLRPSDPDLVRPASPRHLSGRAPPRA